MWELLGRFKKGECSRARELLSGYVDRRLDPGELAWVEEHLATCKGCCEELKSLRATVALLRRLPEVTSRRSFAVVPVRPVPYRKALPALRFATVAVVLLLAVAFTVDGTNALQKKDDLGMTYRASTTDQETKAVGYYWMVEGLRNTVDPVTKTVENSAVTLVVPDDTDNVHDAVNSLAADGVLYGILAACPDGEAAQLALTEDRAVYGAREEQEFAVVTFSSTEQSHFAVNDGGNSTLAFVDIIGEQSGAYLNVAAASDNNALYSFNLDAAQRKAVVTRDDDWLRALEYGLIGLATALGAAAALLWLKQRRAKVLEAGRSRD